MSDLTAILICAPVLIVSGLAVFLSVTGRIR